MTISLLQALVGPPIAQTVVHMGIEMSNVITHRSLRDALAHFVARHG